MFENRLNCDTFPEHVRPINMADYPAVECDFGDGPVTVRQVPAEVFTDPFWEMTFEEAIREAERRNAEEN